MSNSERTERLILIAAVLCIAVFSYFLYDDSLLFPRMDDSGLPLVGEVSLSDRDVRLKSATAFTWFPASKSADVRLRDSIFTGEASSARIRLKDGADLEIKENSLITLNDLGGQLSLDLRYGDLTSRLGSKPLQITSGGETFTIDGGGVISLRKNSSGEVEFSVTEGSARIRSSKGSHSLSAGKGISFGKNGFNEIGPVAKIETLTPDGVRYFKVKASDPLATQWKAHPKVKTYSWELCEDENCSRIARKSTSPLTSGGTKEPLPEGKYYWRVTGLDAEGRKVAASDIQSLNLQIARPPQITTRPESAVLSKEVKVPSLRIEPKASAEISWSADTPVLRYEYELARSPDFSDVLHRSSNADGRVRTPELPNGLYYYHVRGVFADGRSTDWSAPQQLQVNLKAILGEKPGAVAFDRRDYDFDAESASKRSPSSVPAPRLSWSRASKAASYKIQISRSPNFENAKSLSVNGNDFNWRDYEPGKWHVRVQAVSKDGVPGAYSAPATLQVVAGRPVLSPFAELIRDAEEGKAAPAVEAKARWTKLPFAKSYRVEISKTPDFASPRALISRSPASTIKVEEPGTYFVRVQGLNGEGDAVTKFSEPRPLTYRYNDPMLPPRLSEPYDRAAIFLQKTEEPMFWLEWTRVKEATAYEVEIAGDEKFEKILFQTESSDPRVLLQNRVVVGRFFWRVRSKIPQEGRVSAWSQARSFEIDSQGAGGFSQ